MEDFFSLIGLLGIPAAATLIASIQARWASRKAKSEKQRIEIEVGGTTTTADREDTEGGAVPVNADQSVLRDPQFKLLLDYYAQSLAQFKAAFRISLFFASLGAIILLGGVGMAVFRAESTGDKYAAITSTVAGTVTTLLSGVLFAFSTRAIRHLDEQTMRLREDRNRERTFERRREMLEAIGDETLRDEVRAAMICEASLKDVMSSYAGNASQPSVGLPPDEAESSRSNGLNPSAGSDAPLFEAGPARPTGRGATRRAGPAHAAPP